MVDVESGEIIYCGGYEKKLYSCGVVSALKI